MTKQGQGKHTPRKQIGFSMLLRQCLLMTKNLSEHYWHIDLNAGSGFNILSDCPGSPIVFLNAAQAAGRSFCALFCDNDPDAVAQLGERLAHRVEQFDSSTIAIRCQDNAIALGEFADWIYQVEPRPQFAHGTVLCDPNGSRAFPTQALIDFTQKFPRIDMILNVNFTLFAMIRNCKGNPKTPGFDNFPDPRDVVGLRPFKTNWLVRNPPPGGHGQNFCIFFGRNTDKGMSSFEEFYPIDSIRGEQIVNSLQRVIPEQPLFWEY